MSCMPWLSTGCMRRHARGTESTAEPSDLTTQHIQQRSDNFVHSSNRWRWKLQRTAAVAFISCWLDYCTSLLYGLPNTLLRLSLCRMSLHDWSVAHNAVIISCQYYANSISNPPESTSSSKWHAFLASHCPGRRLYTWPTTAISCLIAFGALCGQLMFWLAWCHEHSVVMATELLQPRDLACETLFQSSCVILTSPTDCSNSRRRETFFGKDEQGTLWLLIRWFTAKHIPVKWKMSSHWYQHPIQLLCNTTKTQTCTWWILYAWRNNTIQFTFIVAKTLY